MLNKEIFSLAIDAYNGKSTNPKYSAEERYEGFINFLKDVDYRRNKVDIFEIVEQTVNAILPKRVFENVKMFAQFKQVKHNETIKFKLKQNAKVKGVIVALGGF